MTNSDRSGRRHHLTWVLIVAISGQKRGCIARREEHSRPWSVMSKEREGCGGQDGGCASQVRCGEWRGLRLVRGGARFGGL